MIVKARKPKRRTETLTRTSPPSATVVTTSKPGPRRREPEPIDPEVEAEVKA